MTILLIINFGSNICNYILFQKKRIIYTETSNKRYKALLIALYISCPQGLSKCSRVLTLWRRITHYGVVVVQRKLL